MEDNCGLLISVSFVDGAPFSLLTRAYERTTSTLVTGYLFSLHTRTHEKTTYIPGMQYVWYLMQRCTRWSLLESMARNWVTQNRIEFSCYEIKTKGINVKIAKMIQTIPFVERTRQKSNETKSRRGQKLPKIPCAVDVAARSPRLPLWHVVLRVFSCWLG